MPIALPVPCLMLVTEPLEPSWLVRAVREAVAGGVNVVQYRDKTLTEAYAIETVRILRRFSPGALFLVNGSPSVALEAGADGVHLPEQGGSIEEARAGVGPGRLIGRSVHSVEAAAAAAQEGADYLIAGTIFASRSHPDNRPAGVELIWAIRATVDLRLIAIGGITPENCAVCLEAGASGFAVLSGILHAADPRAAARSYSERITAHSGK